MSGRTIDSLTVQVDCVGGGVVGTLSAWMDERQHLWPDDALIRLDVVVTTATPSPPRTISEGSCSGVSG